MLLLEDVPVRWRTLLARRQFLDRHADTIAVAKRGEAEVSVAHGKARHVGPLRPRDVGRGDGPGWRDFLRRGRQRGGSGKRVSVSVNLGGSSVIQKKKH